MLDGIATKTVQKDKDSDLQKKKKQSIEFSKASWEHKWEFSGFSRDKCRGKRKSLLQIQDNACE